jgi:hypothetical protein
VKQVVAVKLMPNADVHAALAETLRVCNEEANRIACVAFANRDHATGRVEREYALRGRVYADAKATGIGSQLAQQVVKKVCNAYAVVYAQVRAGLLQGERAAKALAKPIRFRPISAQPFDDRTLRGTSTLNRCRFEP